MAHEKENSQYNSSTPNAREEIKNSERRSSEILFPFLERDTISIVCGVAVDGTCAV
jgi:hypothetical protein